MEKTADKTKCPTWKQRSKMERYLILVCIILIVAFLIMTGLLIHFQNIYKRNSEEEEVCLTPVCQFTAGRVLEKMDYSVQPCEDFYSFSCGSYMKYKNIYADTISAFSELYWHMKVLSKEILEKPGKQNEPRFASKVRKYYQSCLKNSLSVKQLLADFLKFTKFDEWPVADDFKSSFEDTMAKFVLYSTDQAFFFYVYTNYKDEFLDCIKIGPALTSIEEHGLLNTTEDSIRLKKQYLDLFRYVFAKLEMKDEEANHYTEEIIQLETSLASIANGQYIRNNTRKTVFQLELECPQIKWTSLIENIYKYLNRQSNYSNNLVIEIEQMDAIIELCKLIKENNPRIIHNLIVWNSFARYLYRTDFIFSQLVDILGKNSRLRIADAWDKKLKWKSCINNFEFAYNYGLHYMLLKAEDYTDKIRKIENYVKQIKKGANQILSRQAWMDDYSKMVSKLMISDLRYGIGYHNSSLDEEKVNTIFDKINVTDNYLYNILQAKKYLFWDFLFDGIVNQFSFRRNDHFDPLVSNVYQYPSGEKIIMPTGVMFPPYYSHGGPNYLNFGGIGTIIAHEISHKFDNFDEDGRWNKYNGTISWSKQFIEKYSRRKLCLMRQYSKFNGNTHTNHKFAENSGIVQAYWAYDAYLKKYGNEPKLPGLEFSNRQMFFIGYAQKECRISGFVKNYEAKNHTPVSYNVLIPLMNFPEFSKAFNCPLNSYMNPKEKCKIWD